MCTNRDLTLMTKFSALKHPKDVTFIRQTDLWLPMKSCFLSTSQANNELAKNL